MVLDQVYYLVHEIHFSNIQIKLSHSLAQPLLKNTSDPMSLSDLEGKATNMMHTAFSIEIKILSEICITFNIHGRKIELILFTSNIEVLI